MSRHGSAALILCLGLASHAFAGTPATDQLVFSGASAPGENKLSFSNDVYSFTFTGDEDLMYQIDLADPQVAGGMLRIHEMSSDSYPIDQGGICFRDAAGLYWMPAANYKKTTLAGHSMSGSVLTLDFVLDFNGLHPFRYQISPEGKQLRIRVTDPTGSVALANNFSGVVFGKTTGIEHPVPIRMQGTLAQPITMFRRFTTAKGMQHYFTANMLDMFQSNSSDHMIGSLLNPVADVDSITSGMDTATGYVVNSSGILAAPLDDTLVIVVSSRIRDVLIDSTAPPSPYHGLLANRMFFNAPSSVWESYDKVFDLYLSLGMYNLAGYFFLAWSSSAIDPPSVHSVGPDWTPALDPPEFESMLQNGSSMGNILGAYTAFNCLPDTAPASVYDPSEIVKDSTGKDKTYTGLGHPLLGIEASGQHAQAEATKLKALGSRLAYLDIQSYGSIDKGPDGGHLDQSSSSPWAKTNRKGYAAQKTWFEGMRTTLVGPLLGEGSICTLNSNMEYLYYGYVDSVQRCINTGGTVVAQDLPAGSPYAPTNWPIIPEYEWRVAVKNQVNHGNGFYERFFGPSDGPAIVEANGQPIYPLTQEAVDLYQAFLITYGHAGFLSTNGAKYATEGYVTHPAAAQTYFMTNALQALYYGAPISTIRYYVEGTWQTFEEVIFDTESLDTFRHAPVRLEFENGLRIYVNHGSMPMSVTENGLTYTLPARTGWYAGTANGGLVSFSAIPPGTGGQRIDYCRASGQYEYFNGRGNVTGYGKISTSAKRSKWNVIPTDLTVTEDENQELTTSLGAPPLFMDVMIVPGDLALAQGERTGLKAVAAFDNGGVLDVTTMLHWYSTRPEVAIVNDAGVLEAVGSGDTKIVGVEGSFVSQPITVTVP